MKNESMEWVLITGASSGLGRGIACELSKAGYLLVLTGRDEERLEYTRSQCVRPERHKVIAFDLGQPDRIYSDFGQHLRDCGVVINGFVHSAGVASVVPARLCSAAEVKRVFDINLVACMELVRTLISLDAANRFRGRMVFISSVAARIGEKGAAVYCASKGALEAFAISLAHELYPEADLGVVAPGMVKTEMTEKYLADANLTRSLAEKYPLGIAEVEDIASVVTFLMTKKSVSLHGRSLSVDGGRCVA